MTNRFVLLTSLVSVLSVIAGCGGSPGPPSKQTTYPVQGQVFVDGQPTPGIGVTCVPAEGVVDADMDKGYEATHSAATDENGNFKISTYGAYDGAPSGEYALIFVWNGAPAAQKNDAAAFNKLYRNSAKSTVKLTVDGAPVDMGKIELKSK